MNDFIFFTRCLLTVTTLLVWRSIIVNASTDKIAIFGWQMNGTLMQATSDCDTRLVSNCEYQNLFSLDLVRINRLFNPESRTRFIILMDLDSLNEHPYYKEQLQRAEVEVRSRAQFRQAGSRALAYEALHAKFRLSHHAAMMSRFCEWADLAKAEGITRIITLDSDTGLFDDVQRLFAPFSEDIVMPCTVCSNNVLWSVKALDAYCDGLIRFWSSPPEEIFQQSVKYSLIQGSRDGWNDMVFLHIFLLENWAKKLQREITWIELTGTYKQGASGDAEYWATYQPSPRIPYPGAWLSAATVMRVHPDMMTPAGLSNALHQPRYNADCKKFQELIKFEPTTVSKIPVPLHISSGLPIPIIHFHQHCKLAVVDKIYKGHYQGWFDASYPR